MKIVASFEYAGMSDYWGGNGRRWDGDAGCVFAYYGRDTTLRELIDSAAEDFTMNGDFEDPVWDGFDSDDVRAALLDCLSKQGRKDYDNNVISEFSADYVAHSDWECRDCGARVGDSHLSDCARLEEMADCGDIDDNFEVEVAVTIDDCDDDYESPVCIFLLELTE